MKFCLKSGYRDTIVDTNKLKWVIIHNNDLIYFVCSIFLFNLNELLFRIIVFAVKNGILYKINWIN
jgi:hypothetical protein